MYQFTNPHPPKLENLFRSCLNYQHIFLQINSDFFKFRQQVLRPSTKVDEGSDQEINPKKTTCNHQLILKRFERFFYSKYIYLLYFCRTELLCFILQILRYSSQMLNLYIFLFFCLQKKKMSEIIETLKLIICNQFKVLHLNIPNKQYLKWNYVQYSKNNFSNKP